MNNCMKCGRDVEDSVRELSEQSMHLWVRDFFKKNISVKTLFYDENAGWLGLDYFFNGKHLFYNYLQFETNNIFWEAYSVAHVRDIIESYLTSSKAEEFAKFVWGEDWNTIDMRSIRTVERWNEKYQEWLKLSPNGEPKDDIPQMIAVWLQISKGQKK